MFFYLKQEKWISDGFQPSFAWVLVVFPLCCCPARALVFVSDLFNKGRLILISGAYFSSPKCLVYFHIMVWWSHRNFWDKPGGNIGPQLVVLAGAQSLKGRWEHRF